MSYLLTEAAQVEHLVQFIDLPDTFTEGRTEEEGLLNAGEVLFAMLAWRVDGAKDVPAPGQDVMGAYYVAPHDRMQT